MWKFAALSFLAISLVLIFPPYRVTCFMHFWIYLKFTLVFAELNLDDLPLQRSEQNVLIVGGKPHLGKQLSPNLVYTIYTILACLRSWWQNVRWKKMYTSVILEGSTSLVYWYFKSCELKKYMFPYLMQHFSWPYLHKWIVPHSCALSATFYRIYRLPTSISWLPSYVTYPTGNIYSLVSEQSSRLLREN